MKYILIALILSGTLLATAQEQLNDYKYIIVPKNFDEFKKENQYQTSTLIKFLLVNDGFNAVYDDQLPEDLNRNRCLGLLVDLLDESSMFSTKITAIFSDCKSVEVYRTQQGTSKEKDYKPAYTEALKMAFNSLRGFTYSYDAPEGVEKPVTVSFRDDVKKMEPTEPPVPTDDRKLVEQEATPEQQRYENREPVPSDMVKQEQLASKERPGEISEKSTNTWYAQAIRNGYQLVDNTPKVRLKIFTTSLPNVFIAMRDSETGLLYLEGSRWLLEYYQGDERKVEEIKIKF